MCALISICLLAFPLTARAGQWEAVPPSSDPGPVVTVISAGTWYTGTMTYPVWESTQTLPAAANAMFGMTDGNGSVTSVSGTDPVGWTLVWVPDPGKTLAQDPPPPASQPVHLIETVYASQLGFVQMWDPSLSADSFSWAGSLADDGWGDPETEADYSIPYEVLGEGLCEHSATSQGSHLVQADGSSGTITLPSHTQSALAKVTSATDNFTGGCEVQVITRDSIDLVRPEALNGSYINKDLPFNLTWEPLPNPLVLYGGSVRFTSDELQLNAADPTPLAGTTYTWSVFGPGNFTPPSGGAIWNVGPMPATPGIVSFDCLLTYPDGSQKVKQLNVELGIRTDDTILVGWIDASGVQLTGGWGGTEAISAGVDPQVVYEFSPGTPALPGVPGGAPGSDSNFPFFPATATAALVALAQNNDFMDFTDVAPTHLYTATDKDYILDWMFKYAPNPDPTPTLSSLHTTDWTNPNVPAPTWDNPNPVPVNTSSDFTCYDGYMDYLKYQAYIQDRHRFKLLNHFQVKYRVDLTNPSQFNGAPTVLQSDALVGATVNPTGIPPDIGPTLSLLSEAPPPFNLPWLLASDANHTLFDPQTGPANGLVGPTPATHHISQCNDGSPEIPAVRAFNTLMGLDVPNPLFWQNIGSKITFQCGNTAPDTPTRENYPTYYYYKNGILLGSFAQAATPQGHFFASPYPFGTDPSYGLPPQWPWGLPVFPEFGSGFPTIPGGRNGIASWPADDPSVPIPPYTVP